MSKTKEYDYSQKDLDLIKELFFKQPKIIYGHLFSSYYQLVNEIIPVSLKKENNYFDTFNIGTGKATSVLELIKGFENSTGINLNYKIGDRRMGDVDQCFAEVSKANNVLNWKSNLSIEDALVSSWNWEKNIYNEKL